MNEPAHKQFKDQPNKDAFTFKVKCHRDDEMEVRKWLKGDKAKVLIAASFMKENSNVYSNIDIDQIAEIVDDIVKYDISDKTKEEEEAEEAEEESEEAEEEVVEKNNVETGEFGDNSDAEGEDESNSRINNLGKFDNVFNPHEQICVDD